MGANEKASATYHPHDGPQLDPAQIEAAARDALRDALREEARAKYHPGHPIGCGVCGPQRDAYIVGALSRPPAEQIRAGGMLSIAVQNAAHLAAWDEYVREVARDEGGDLPVDLDERFEAAWEAFRRSQPAAEADDLREKVTAFVAHKAISARARGDQAERDWLDLSIIVERSQPAPRTVTAEERLAVAQAILDADRDGLGYHRVPVDTLIDGPHVYIARADAALAALGITVEADRG